MNGNGGAVCAAGAQARRVLPVRFVQAIWSLRDRATMHYDLPDLFRTSFDEQIWAFFIGHSPVFTDTETVGQSEPLASLSEKRAS